MTTARGAIPRRLAPVLLLETMPSLSSLSLVPRLDESAGDTSGIFCGFRDVMAIGIIGMEGGNFVRFGRGIMSLRSWVDEREVADLRVNASYQLKTRLYETSPMKISKSCDYHIYNAFRYSYWDRLNHPD